jgi:tRNA (adenine22-N1)-methyltransferase
MLSGRLQKIHSFYTHQQSIWDIGCDHGQLGLSFQGNSEIEEIHLVDPSDKVIEALHLKLKDSDIPKQTLLKIHHNFGQKLKLNSLSKCIFIAGMGGKEILEILKNFETQISSGDQVVISPHRNILILRDYLSKSTYCLRHEEVLWEDDQFYPMLVLDLDPRNPKVSLYGENLWRGEPGAAYKKHQLHFFGTHQDEASQAYLAYLRMFKL